jgi:hypothetical protein
MSRRTGGVARVFARRRGQSNSSQIDQADRTQ